MKAMVLDDTVSISRLPLKMAEVPLPEPATGEVRIRLSCCAICRTDLHVIEGDLPRATLPIIPGHQAIGVVEAIGPHGTRFALGDRVGIAWLRSTCGRCRYCKRGNENLCEEARFTGYHANGGYAEYAIVREDFAYPIPSIFTDLEAAPLLCAGIVGYRALKRSLLPDGGSLGIFGFGSSAHVIIQIAKHRKAKTYVVTRGEKHRHLARDLGADWVGESFEGMPAKLDSAILFAPAGTLVPPALEALDKGGTLALAGIHMSPIPPLDYAKHLFYERNLHSVTANTRSDGEELLAEAAKIPIRPHVDPYPLVDANRALQDLRNDQISGTGVLIMR